jgi:hypothetical protein
MAFKISRLSLSLIELLLISIICAAKNSNSRPTCICDNIVFFYKFISIYKAGESCFIIKAVSSEFPFRSLRTPTCSFKCTSLYDCSLKRTGITQSDRVRACPLVKTNPYKPSLVLIGLQQTVGRVSNAWLYDHRLYTPLIPAILSNIYRLSFS